MFNFSKFSDLSNRFKLYSKIFGLLLIFSYLLFHTIQGENGLLSYIKIKHQVAEESEKLEQILENLEILKKRVQLLSSDSLDRDMLEERSRIVLNYCYPNEIIIREKSILS